MCWRSLLALILHMKAPTARNVQWRIRAVLEWAVVMELRTANPCDRLAPCWVPSMTWCSHCGPCRIARWHR